MRCVVILLCCVCAVQARVEGFGRHIFVGNGVNQVLHHLEREGGALATTAESNATTYFYNQAVVDHFGAEGAVQTQAFWAQRYYVDETFWRGEGYPIFVYIGGEGPQGPPSKNLFMATLAEEHGALMVAVEHRFYGASHPTRDMSNKNLRYLTSTQALADLARITSYIKAQSGPSAAADTASSPPLKLSASARSSRVIGFGGSYPGDLAAWVRLKYPAIFDGTVASSAPVYAEYNFEQYAQVVGTAMKYPLIGGSAACFNVAKAGAEALRALVTSTTPMGSSDAIPAALMPCGAINDELDLSMYEQSVFGLFQGAVQYNLEGRPPYVSDVCAALVKPGATPLQRLADAAALFANQSLPFKQRCQLSSWKRDQIRPLKQLRFDNESSMRQWIWQSCNEFGFFQTTSGANHPFAAFKALGIEYAGRLICEQAYNLKGYKQPNTQWANTNYGNRDLQATNVVTPNGNMDPWHALGLVNKTDAFYNSCTSGPCPSQALATSDALVTIDGTAHCRDMYRPDIFADIGVPDTPSVVWAHAKIRAAVSRFLA